MRIQKLLHFVVLCLLLNPFIIHAQETQQKPQNKVISFVPQYFINNGIRIDFDYRLNDRHWLQLAPQIYLSQSDLFGTYNITIDELAGLGLGIYDRIYFGPETANPEGGYFAYGLMGQLFSIKYHKETYNYDILESYTTNTKYKTTIKKIGVDFVIGRQFNIEDIFIIDFYMGAAIRYANLKQDVKNNYYFNDTPWGYGHTGTMLVGGFRVGIAK